MSMRPVPEKYGVAQGFYDTFSTQYSGTAVHGAIDYATPVGVKVAAPDDGVIEFAGESWDLPGGPDDFGARWYLVKAARGDRKGGGGRIVVLRNNLGSRWIFTHLSTWKVSKGDRVKMGDHIADTGETGVTHGAHLHVGLLPPGPVYTNYSWGRIDPQPFITEAYRLNSKKGGGMIWLTDLADKLRAQGLTVVEVPGWKTRGYGGLGFYGVAGVLHHHTATGRAAFARSNAPTLNLLTHGRSDLAGPLCNLAFGRDGTVYVVAAGWANHAGRGSAPGFPRDQGNGWLIGIEAESSGVAPWDWTKDQLRVWPYLAAALEQVYLSSRAASLRLQLGHKEYSSEGKIDPAGISMDQFRASVNKILSSGGKTAAPAKNTKDWFDMATEADLRRIVREEIKKNLQHAEFKDLNGKTQTFNQIWIFRTRKAERLLGAIAEAVKPSRVALAVWGYAGKTAHKFDNGKLMDAYATLNELLRHAQLDSEQLGSTTTKEAK